MKKIIIAAISENNIIGKNGILPWKSKEEMTVFKQLTTNNPVIMGRKTYDSLKRVLKGRTNLILSHSVNERNEKKEVKFFNSFSSVYKFCEKENYEKVFIIGGGEVFKEEINNVDEMFISIMKGDFEGDVFFPEINENIWHINMVVYYSDFILYKYIRNSN
ncbi:dihydrofolate reductase type 3 [bacterium BMS3Abin04]|nr:dihydrofolate reductase type 3 [bacterium BMS3Abin04]